MTRRPTRLLIFSLVLAAFISGSSVPEASGGQVEQRIVDVTFSQESGFTSVAIVTTATPINYTYYTADTDTLVLEILGAVPDGIPELINVATDELHEIRIEGAERAAGMTHLEFKKSLPCPQRVYVEGSTLLLEFQSCEPPVTIPQGVLDEARSMIQDGAAGEDPPAPAEQPAQALPREARTMITPRAPRKAMSLQEISVNSRGDGVLVDIRGDGALSYHDFVLDEPDRLVIDFMDVTNELPVKNYDVYNGGVRRIRTSQFQDYPERIARVVLDLDDPGQYRLQPVGSTLKVLFGGNGDGFGAYAPSDGGAADALDLLKDGYVNGDDSVPGAMSGALLPFEAAPQADTAEAPAVIGVDEAISDYEGRVIGDTGVEYEGELISFDLKDADIKDILRFFSDISGLNIILDPEVRGNVTVRLTDVPWDQALDIILKNQGYGKDLRGNVLRIAPHTKLAREEEEERAFKEQQELNVDLITVTRPISYARATNVKTILDQVISRRGNIIVDDRTNTLVIKEVDLPKQQRLLSELINTLDKPTPQVEIEARIVETTKTYARSFGIQWGFSGIADALTGTTTDLVFPNNFKIAGDLISSGGFSSELPNEGWAVNLPAPGANAAVGLQFGSILDTVQLDLVLSALENDGYGRVLSAPKVTTQNNVNASIEAGTQIPYQTIANNTVTTTFVSASLQLNVTPQITADNTIIMTITVTQNSADFAQSVAVGEGVVPSIATRRATTQVLVPDGGTTVIGGVFQIRETDNSNKVPVLSKVPLLKYLFANRARNRDNTELLIFITPRIKKFQR